MLKKLRIKFIMINMALVTAVLFIVLTVNLVSTYQVEKKEIYQSLDRVMEINNNNNQNIDPQVNPQGEEGNSGGAFIIEGDGEETQGENPGENPGVIDPGSTDPGAINPESGNPGTIDPGTGEVPGDAADRKDEIPNMNDENLPQIYAFSVTVNSSGEITNTFAFNSEMDDDTIESAVKEVLSSDDLEGTISSLDLIYKKKNISENEIQISFSSLSSLNEKMNRTLLISILIFVIGFGLLFVVSFILSGLVIKPIAEAWNKQKRFIADASHDLKTPLTVILANNNILKSHKEESVENEMKWIESTEEETLRMKSMVEKMLELSKSDNMKDNIKLSSINISNTIEEILFRMDPIAFEGGTSINSDIEKDIMLDSNYEALSRLVEILIDNAIKYTKDNNPIQVTLSKKKKEVLLLVNNKGDIINEQDLPYLFDRFYRTDKARSTSGYGLGLSIAKNIVEALNGTIKATSDEINGTTFVVTLKAK